MPSRRGKFEGSDAPLEREMVDCDPTLKIGQNCAASLVNGQQQVSFRGKIQAIDVRAVGEGKGIGSIARKFKSVLEQLGRFHCS